MLTTSKQEPSASVDQPAKLNSRFKYDLRVSLKFADELLMNNHIPQSRSFLGIVTKELKKTIADQLKVPEASELLTILQEADKALLAGKTALAHSCMRLAIKELNNND